MALSSRVEVRGRIPPGFHLRLGWASNEELGTILDWISENVNWSKRDAYGIPVANFSSYQENFPAWAERLARRLSEEGIVTRTPNHIHLTRYEVGRGIPPHIDATNSAGMTFGDEIAALALRSSRVLEITRKRSTKRLRALLFPGDLYVITGRLRYKWEHGIPHADVDEFRGASYPRTDGISVTWRALSPA